MKNILLINPKYEKQLWWVADDIGPVVHDFIPLGPATIAAMTPNDFRVDIWDEIIRGPINEQTKFECNYDLVGLSGYRTHIPRCRELARIFHKRGIPVAFGGPGVSGAPDLCGDDFDILFIGEAEKTWLQFLRDWQSGNYRSEYRQIEKPDLVDSPVPKWDSIASDLYKYAMGCVQTTRGCPFDCEFCDVIYLFGRRPRHKPIERVLEEVKVLERLGMSGIFFCDDDFIGSPRYAKELLRALIPLNNSFVKPLTYTTQATITLSNDDEMLELMADANFHQVFIGIETPNVESLKETGKYHNVRKNLVADVHKILSYGIAIRAGIIVGFDHDDINIFDTQYNFIQEACMPIVLLNVLNAPVGTRLWRRLREEGRVLNIADSLNRGQTRGYTNIQPKMMSRIELLKGYRDLAQKIYSWESFSQRVRGFVSLARRQPKVNYDQPTNEQMTRLGSTLNTDRDGHKAIEEITEHVRRHAPWLMRTVRELVIQHARYRQTVAERLPEQVSRQIELESSGKVIFKKDNRPVPIPGSFRAKFNQIFSEVYKRTYLNLTNKDNIPEAMIEIFVDFLVRWGSGFKQLEEHHIEFLKEIVDRTCTKFNGQPPQDFQPITAGAPIEDVRRARLSDDVLKSVEQELIKLVQTKTN
jgi:radical SAM superfamily enzyme YgiQ (UPF0313 family)